MVTRKNVAGGRKTPPILAQNPMASVMADHLITPGFNRERRATPTDAQRKAATPKRSLDASSILPSLSAKAIESARSASLKALFFARLKQP